MARFFSLLACLLCLAESTSATEPTQVDYMLHCQGCHLADGSGFPERNVPTLTNHLGKFLGVEGGREFLVRVPGSAQSDLSDQRLAELLNWMLVTFSGNELPHHFRPYTAKEVGGLRRTPLPEVAALRAKLIERIKISEQQDMQP